MSDLLETIKETIINARPKEIEDLVRSAVDEGADLNAMINEYMIPAMDVVGQRFSINEIFVPEMLASAVTMKKGLDIIRPILRGKDVETRGTIVMCTVKGDIHDIGKNLVNMMLEGAGFHVVDLGVNMDAEELIDKLQEIKPHVLGLSALLTTTMPEMERVIKNLETRGLKDHMKVMVGGAPVDGPFAEKIGADGYGRDAIEAVRIARAFTATPSR